MSNTLTSGTTTGLVISGDEFVLNNAVITQSTLSGASSELILESGAISNFITIDASLAVMEVDLGATANSTLIENQEEQVYGVDNKGQVTGGSYIFNGQTTYTNATQLLYSGGDANNTTIGGGTGSSSGAQWIYTGATADDAIILAHGEQDTYGGIARNSTVDAGGILETALGGTFVSATINSGGTETLASTSSNGTIHIGTDIDSIVETGGTQIVESGAQVLDDLVYGLQQIDTGATANSDLIGAGGTALVQGVLIGDMAINGGFVELEPGASAGSEMQFTGTGGTLELAPGSVFTGTRIVGFDYGDTIILQGITGALAFSTITDVLTIGSTDIQLSGITTASSFTGTLTTIAGTAGTEITLEQNAECFLAGTRIMTKQGAVAVETLQPGNEILMASGKTEKIQWIGRRTYSTRFATKNHLVRPIRISANAIADNVPQRDLHVSPGHGIFIDCVLVPAWRLINGKTITQPELAQAEIDYYHIELTTHAVLLAENCPAESYLDIGARNQFQNALICPHRAPNPVTPLPRVENGMLLEAIKAKLNARAGIQTRAENPANPIIGYVDRIGPNTVSGWALCPADPETPITLDIYFWRAGTLNRKSVLANIYRADLRNAGLGTGCHGFEAELPAGATRPRVLRSAGLTPLSLTETAREMAA